MNMIEREQRKHIELLQKKINVQNELISVQEQEILLYRNILQDIGAKLEETLCDDSTIVNPYSKEYCCATIRRIKVHFEDYTFTTSRPETEKTLLAINALLSKYE